MYSKQNITNNIPHVFLKTKRKALGLTQDEFAKLFDLTKDSYRKYEEAKRIPPDNLFRMMKIIIDYYEKENTATETIVSKDFLESARQECLSKIFREEQHDIVNMIFDYLTRKTD